MRVPVCLVLFIVSAAFTTGCEKPPVYYPVEGKLTVNNKPLLAARLQFIPDVSRGNTFTSEPRGKVDPATGSYSITTDGKNGCPPGWYKVVIFAFAEPGPGEGPKPPVWLASQKYADPKTTDLSIEVTASPKTGQYDFNLSQQ
jgi:hypothetical protein